MGARTLYLYYIFDAPIERVFNAFTDQYAMPKWLPPYGYTAEIKHLDVKTGGRYEAVIKDFKSNRWFTIKGDYLAVIPNQFICYTDQFFDSNGESMGPMTEKTVMFSSDFTGTELKIHQTNLSERPPREDLNLNWQESFSLLELLVND